MSITAKELAKLLGLSPTTVSMVLNNKGQISRKTRQLVLQAAAEYGLRWHSKSYLSPEQTLLLAIYRHPDSDSRDAPLLEPLVQGLISAAQKLRYQTSVLYLCSDQSPEEQLRLVEEQPSAGVLLLSTKAEDADAIPFRKLKRPIVLLGNWQDQRRFDCVAIDNRNGVLLAIHHLSSLGHTRIGYLTSVKGSRTFTDRRDAYHQAMEECFPEVPSASVLVPVAPTLEGAYQDMLEYLSSNPVLPTAFLADSDLIAAGCLMALQQTGHNVPEKLSLIGFGNLPLCEVTTPPLTTMMVSGEQMGTLAIQFLEQRLRGTPPTAPTKALILPELLIRDSTAKPLGRPEEHNS